MSTTDENPAFPPSPLQHCPACERPLVDHAHSDRRITLEMIAREAYVHDFDEATAGEFMDIYPDSHGDHEVVLRLLRCPAGGGAILPLALARSVMDDDRVIGLVLRVDAGNMNGLAAAAPDAWHEYGTTWTNRETP